MEFATVVTEGPVLKGGLGGVILILFIAFIALVFTAIKVFGFCRIFSKAGYSWAFGLLMLLPMSEVVIPLILAFMDWPVCKELRLFKQEQSSGSK
jgi:Na+-transporting NADH:ubiquinone oxidoreductase subunit NqrD